MDLRTTPLVQLPELLLTAEEKGDQLLVNLIAMEIAYRLYVPNKGISFEELITQFGYKEIQKEEKQILSLNKKL